MRMISMSFYHRGLLLIPIILLVCAPTISAVTPEFKVLLDTQSEVKLQSITVEIKDFPDHRQYNQGDHLWELRDADTIYSSSYFYVNMPVFYDIADPKTGQIVDGGMKIVNLDEVEFFIPYHPNADRIIIYEVNQSSNDAWEILEIDVGRFAKNITTEKVVEEQKPYLDSQEQAFQASSESRKQLVYIMAIAVLMILTIIVAFELFRKRGKS